MNDAVKKYNVVMSEEKYVRVCVVGKDIYECVDHKSLHIIKQIKSMLEHSPETCKVISFQCFERNFRYESFPTSPTRSINDIAKEKFLEKDATITYDGCRGIELREK